MRHGNLNTAHVTLAGLALAALVDVSAAAAASPPDTFTDQFHSIDSRRWNVSDGWSNGAWYLNDWRRSQFRPLSGGGLRVTIDKNPASKNGYSSGEIQSRNLYLYGYYEARMTAAAGSGIVTGFFTYIGAPFGRPWNEIDVEILGKDTHAVEFTYHVGQKRQTTVVRLPLNSALTSHTFGFDWQADHISWYIDGKLAHTERGDAPTDLPIEPEHIIFDVWNSNVDPAWMGLFSWPGHPITAQLTCVSHTARYEGRELLAG